MHMEEKAVTVEMQHQQWELVEVEAGGGYPAAGIGGGGAGGGAGDTAEGGGGFSSGGGEANGARGENGSSGKKSSYDAGGAYFETGDRNTTSGSFIGGSGADKNTSDDYRGGSGGTAGNGGNITVSSNCTIKAYNGSYITNEENQTEEWKANNASIIYAQLGYNIEQIRNASKNGNSKYNKIKVRNAKELISELGNNYRTIKYNDYFGIGSGAGYIESSNGTYKVDDKLN